jgi:hypothetical protein
LQETELFQNIKEEYICGYRTGAVLGGIRLQETELFQNIKEGFISGSRTGAD